MTASPLPQPAILKEEHQKAGAVFAFVHMDCGAITKTVNRGRKR
jgi:hypothetical protein